MKLCTECLFAMPGVASGYILAWVGVITLGLNAFLVLPEPVAFYAQLLFFIVVYPTIVFPIAGGLWVTLPKRVPAKAQSSSQ